jgi:asparagine synthase (glutamine-hydrolysing)
MCGIYGMAVPAGTPLTHPAIAPTMGALLRHRGPDGSGCRERPHVMLGAERLRVVDPSPRADQPFADPGERVWLVANGEIYNAVELRRRYPGYPFRSRSDIEVIIPLYLAAGVAGLADLAGMFALALWDETERRLVLARDRAGEKPLFYSDASGEVLFASEIQALLCHPRVTRDLDSTALGAFCGLGYVPGPRTMFRGVRAVAPGSAVVLEGGTRRTCTYWRPERFPPVDQPGDPVGALRELLQTAVERQVRADVPVGVFTSGGVDSSLVAALAARAAGPESVHTFTVRFTTAGYDESRWGRLLARRLGTRHVEVVADEAALTEALDVVTERLAEPIADPALLPTWLLARAARRHVTVVLGGEGADELFGGYPTYLGHALAPAFQRLPAVARGGMRRLARTIPDSAAKVPLSLLLKRFLGAADGPWPARHLAWLGTGLDPAALMACDASPLMSVWPMGTESADPLAGAMLLDFRTYLPDQLLVKLDRATMLVALEARSPYLDPAVMEFGLRLDPRLKVRGLTTKRLLKLAARAWLPPRIVRRRKRGLSVPIAAWLRGGLRAEVGRLLAPDRLRRQGVVSDVYVARLVAEHLAGRANHARALWTLIVLERWLERWVPEV